MINLIRSRFKGFLIVFYVSFYLYKLKLTLNENNCVSISCVKYVLLFLYFFCFCEFGDKKYNCAKVLIEWVLFFSFSCGPGVFYFLSHALQYK